MHPNSLMAYMARLINADKSVQVERIASVTLDSGTVVTSGSLLVNGKRIRFAEAETCTPTGVHYHLDTWE